MIFLKKCKNTLINLQSITSYYVTFITFVTFFGNGEEREVVSLVCFLGLKKDNGLLFHN